MFGKKKQKTGGGPHGGVGQRHKYRPREKALREIRQYQKSVEPLIKFAPFARLCKEVSQKFRMDVRFQV